MAFRGPSVTRFERRGQPVATRRKFAARMIVAIGMWLILTFAGLAIGIAGYVAVLGQVVLIAVVTAMTSRHTVNRTLDMID